MTFTIIVVGYHQTAVSAHMTMACLANITKYTNPDDYELILVEDIPKVNIRDDFHVLKIDRHIILDEYTPFSQKVNLAAKEAKGEYLAIIQNDCFVWEGWLEAAKYYLDSGIEALVPDQIPRTRQYILESYDMTLDQGLDMGYRDACMMILTKRAFNRAKGYNPDMTVLVEGDFYERLRLSGTEIHTTNKIQVTHITLATHYQDMDLMERGMQKDSLVGNRLA